MSFQPPDAATSYLPTAPIAPTDEESFDLWVTDLLSQVAFAVNQRAIGQYEETEYLSGRVYFTPDDNQIKRYVYRKVVDFGALPNAGTKSVAHGLTWDAAVPLLFTHIYGTASDTSGFTAQPLPNTDIHVDLDDTNVNVTTTNDETAYDTCYIVLEYIRERG